MHYEIVPIEEAAERAEVSRRNLERWVDAGEVEVFHREKDRRTFVDLEDVLRRKAGFVRGRKHRDA